MEARNYPRQGHYHLAHVALPRDAQADGANLWNVLTGPDSAAALEMLQAEAAAVGESRGEPGEVKGMAVEGVERRGEWELLVLRFPEPLAPTEAFMAALARRADEPREVGYFVLERSSQGEGYVAEWRRGGRIRMQPLPAGDRRHHFVEQVFEELVSRGRPAFPGLGDFASAAAPAVGLSAAPGPGAAPPPARRGGAGRTVLITLAVLVVLIGGLAALGRSRAPDVPEAPPTPVAASVPTPGTPAAVAEAEEAAAAAGTAPPTAPGAAASAGALAAPAIPAGPGAPPAAVFSAPAPGTPDAMQMSKQLQVSAMLGQAAQAMGAQDWKRAGILFNLVLRLDPANALARSGRQMVQAQKELGRGRRKPR